MSLIVCHKHTHSKLWMEPCIIPRACFINGTLTQEEASDAEKGMWVLTITD